MSVADALRARVLAADSVTEAMTEWCGERGIGRLPLRSEVHVRAERAELPRALATDAPGERASFRRITLWAGSVPLLDAETWFLPDRLPTATVATLEEGDTPFGTALRPGRQSRRSTGILVPPGAERHSGAEIDPAVEVLVLRGIVSLDDRTVAYVEERFRPDALG